MQSVSKRFRLFLYTSALVLVLAAPVWGAETIQLPGNLPEGQSIQYDMVYFSNRSTLASLNHASDYTGASITGQLNLNYSDQIVDGQLPFEYGIRDFAFRSPDYIAAGIMSSSARFSGRLSEAGDVLVAELHPRLFELGLYLEHIIELTVFVSPQHEVAVGDTWNRSIQTQAGTGSVSADITYTLHSIDHAAGIALIVVEAQRSHTDLPVTADDGRTVKRESETFGVIELSLETGNVLSAVVHNRINITRIPSYALVLEGKAAIERMQFLNDIRIELAGS